MSRMIGLTALDKFNVNSFDTHMVSCLRDAFLIAGKIWILVFLQQVIARNDDVPVS